MSEALTTGQQALNQRLLALHCLSDEDMAQLYAELQDTYADDLEGISLVDTVSACNAQLQYIGLEIVAVNMPLKEEQGKHQRHYAMVNKFPDDIAKTAFQSHLFQPPQQQAFVKAVLQTLVEASSGEVDEQHVTRATLLNLKNDVQLPTITAAEDCLQRLVEEKWVVEVSGRKGSNNAVIQLGPRTYCELSYMLTENFGMEANNLPQQIILR